MRSTHDHGTTDDIGDITDATSTLSTPVTARNRRRLTAVAAGVAAGVAAALALGGLSTVSAHDADSADSPRDSARSDSARSESTHTTVAGSATAARLFAETTPIGFGAGTTGGGNATATTLTHGGTGGTPVSLTLGPAEHLTSVTLTRGRKDGRTRVFSAAFTTDTGRTVRAGSPTSDTATYTAPTGWRIVGFTGRAGDEIDKLGVLFAPR